MSKRDFLLSKPLMNAAGSLGFAPDYSSRAAEVLGDFGAFVTNPLSLRPRRPAARPATIEFPGGFLLHSGLPNPGLEAALKKYAAKWARADLPIIVHLMADRPEETSHMVRRLEGVENVLAAELGFAPQLADEIILVGLEMSLSELPLIVSLPFEQALRLGAQIVALGAVAVSLAAPRGLLSRSGSESETGPEQWLAGRLFGPGLFPQALLTARDAARAGIPIIGGCGVYSSADAAAMLEAGALAVQVDTALWRGDFGR
jgi:dihydroorotate dehydrogenase (NAD+) catalytic subunit